MNEVDIKKKLEEFRVNKKAIEQICFLCRSCGLDVILNVAFKYEMYDVVLDLFQPMEIDGEIKMYFDLFTYLSESSLSSFIERFPVSDIEKENIIHSIYTIDVEKLRKMKIENTLPRQITGWGHPINSRNDVIYYAEPACLEAMLSLFNKNIRTTMNDTTCVCIDREEKGICTIWIDYDSLSEENKEIAHDLLSIEAAYFVSGKVPKTLAIQVSCTKDETVGNVSDKLKNIVNHFRRQPILYGFYTKEQMIMRMEKVIYLGIHLNHYLPDGSETYLDYCMKLIENKQIPENPDGSIQTEDGKIFLVDDVVDIMVNSTTFVQSYIDYMGYYYDEENGNFWESKALYERVQSIKKKDNQKEYRKV